MDKQRVAITGLGMISALGLSVAENWQKLTAGKSGIGPIRLFDTAGNVTKIAAQLPESKPTGFRSVLPNR